MREEIVHQRESGEGSWAGEAETGKVEKESREWGWAEEPKARIGEAESGEGDWAAELSLRNGGVEKQRMEFDEDMEMEEMERLELAFATDCICRIQERLQMKTET